MEYKESESNSSVLKKGLNIKINDSGPVVLEFSLYNCDKEFANINFFYTTNQLTKAKEAIVLFGNTLRRNVVYSNSYVEYKIPEVLFNCSVHDDPSLASVSLYTLSQIIRAKTTEFRENTPLESVAQVIAYNFHRSEPLVSIFNSTFCCLLSLLQFQQEVCCTFFMELDQADIEKSIVAISTENVTNYGLKLTDTLLECFVDNDEVSSRIITITFNVIRELDPESPSILLALSTVSYIINKREEDFNRMSVEFGLINTLNAMLPNLPPNSRGQAMVIIANGLENISIDPEIFIDLAINDDITENRIMALFAIGRILLHHPELLMEFAANGIVERLMETIDCSKREKNEKIYVLCAYAKLGTTSQKLYLVENNFIQTILEKTDADDSDFFDLIVECVISLVHAIIEREGQEKAFEFCVENDIPDLINDAMKGENHDIAVAAELFFKEMVPEDESD